MAAASGELWCSLKLLEHRYSQLARANLFLLVAVPALILGLALTTIGRHPPGVDTPIKAGVGKAVEQPASQPEPSEPSAPKR